jgi:uncharacterized membrane protein (UPF0136 family)
MKTISNEPVTTSTGSGTSLPTATSDADSSSGSGKHYTMVKGPLIRRALLSGVIAAVLVGAFLIVAYAIAWLGERWPGPTAVGMITILVAWFIYFCWGVVSDESDNEGW